MPSTASSVRGLSREIPLKLMPDESCEHMMRRIDTALTDAVCRHLVGAASRAVAPARPGPERPR